LKQCVLDLITTEDGDVPLFVRVGDGNDAKSSYNSHLPETLYSFQSFRNN